MTIKLVHLSTIAVSLRQFEPQMRNMAARSLEVHAICSPGEFADELRSRKDVLVHTIPMSRAIAPLQDLQSLIRLYFLLRAIRPQIVHAHTPKAGLLGTLAAFLARVPVRIYHIRGFRFQTAHGWRRRILICCEKIACLCAHRVFCLGNSLREVSVSEGIVAVDKIRVPACGSSNGIDATHRFNPNHHALARGEVREQFGIPSEALVIGFVGRIVRDKGIGELSAAWQRLRERFPSLYLMIVGWFDDDGVALPAGIREFLERDPRVILTGEVRDTPRFYAAMDVFCLPTYREGLGNVLLEAGAMQLPVVATRVTGCVDVVHDGITGTLVDHKSAAQLEAAILRYIDNPQLAEAHGIAARYRVLSDFSPEGVWQAVYEEYCELLAKRVGISTEGSLSASRKAA